MNLTRDVKQFEIKTDIAIDYSAQEFELDDVIKRLEQVRTENPGWTKITVEICGGYGGEVYIKFWGHRLETDEEFEKRLDVHKRVSQAWTEHDNRKQE